MASLFLTHSQEISVLTDSYDCFILEYDHPFSFLADKLPACFPSGQRLSQKELIHIFLTSRNMIGAIAISETQFLLLADPSDNPFAFCCQLQQNLPNQFEHSFRSVIIAKNQPIQECTMAVSRLRPVLSEIYFYPVSSVIEGMYLHPQSDTADTSCLFPPIADIQKDTCDRVRSRFQLIFDKKNFTAFCQMTDELIRLLLTYHNHLVHPSSGEIVTIFSPEDLPKENDVDSVYQWLYRQLALVTDILAMSHFSKYSGIVKEAVFLISRHYSNCNLNVEWIAEQLKISPSGLNAQFKRETNHTPWKIIINTRLEAARKLLLQGMNPTQVYLCTGYNSLSYFSKAFKKAYGCSPQDYRRSSTYETDQI